MDNRNPSPVSENPPLVKRLRTAPAGWKPAMLFALLASLFLPAAGFASPMAETGTSQAGAQELDYSTTHISEKGAFKVSFLSLSEPVPLGKIHSWRLHVEDAKGQPLSDARIGVDGGMPEHRHGLPTKPEVTQNIGNGDYLVEGMKFQMSGWWVVRFTISSGGTSDTVTFNLRL